VTEFFKNIVQAQICHLHKPKIRLLKCTRPLYIIGRNTLPFKTSGYYGFTTSCNIKKFRIFLHTVYEYLPCVFRMMRLLQTGKIKDNIL
jgi:hypothetical protein